MSTAPLVCLITPGHVSSTPRLVKEAAALRDAGFRVHVVYGRHFRAAEALDADLLRDAGWQCTPVPYGANRRAFAGRVLQRLARHWTRAFPTHLRPAVRAQHSESGRFAAAAAAIGADLYIGHCIAGLAAAAAAASRSGTLYAFDAEDFHEAETTHANAAAIAAIQRRFLPQARYITASSPLIADAYRTRYGVEPKVVLNVFSTSDAPSQPVIRRRISAESPARLYWFSQTIGPDRGLEQMLPILARMRTPAELNLRGFVSVSYRNEIDQRARDAALKFPVKWLPPESPTKMVRLAAEAHVGLSLECSSPLNRDLCLTNKVFTYLAASLPQLLSPTRAQRALAGDLGEAALLVEQPETTAQSLDALLQDSRRYESACTTASLRFRTRYCWDIERATFLQSVGTALEGSPTEKLSG